MKQTKQMQKDGFFSAVLRSMLYSQGGESTGAQLSDTPPTIQHSVVEPFLLNNSGMGRRSPFRTTVFDISLRVPDEAAAKQLGTRFCRDLDDDDQLLLSGLVRALDVSNHYPSEAYTFASRLGKGLPGFIHASAAYFDNGRLSGTGLCNWGSAADDALLLPSCPENSATCDERKGLCSPEKLEQRPWSCECLPGYEGSVEYTHVEDLGGSFEISGSCTAIKEFCQLDGDVALKQKDGKGNANGVLGELALPSCLPGYRAEGETTCTEEKLWVPDPQHLCHWIPPKQQPEPYCDLHMLTSPGLRVLQGCEPCPISQGASCNCMVECDEGYKRSGGGEEGSKKCLRETFLCPRKVVFKDETCVDEETNNETKTFCCKESWGENMPPGKLESRNCGEISKDKDCLSSMHDGSSGSAKAGEPCCWQRQGRKCAPESEHLAAAVCAATNEVIDATWSDMPTCTPLPVIPPRPVCENKFARLLNLVHENCDGCKPEEPCNCTVRCKPGTKQPFGEAPQGAEGIRECVWRGENQAEFEPPPNCQGICETPNNQSGLLDVSRCKNACTVGAKKCKCKVSCAAGAAVFSGDEGKKLCTPTGGGQEYERSPECRPVCVKPDNQFNQLEVVGCSGCVAGTDCSCRLKCRGDNKALRGREGEKVCKLLDASAGSLPTAEWVDKLHADRDDHVSGVPQCLPPITIQVVDALRQQALEGVTIEVYIASSNKEENRLLERLSTDDSKESDKSVKFYSEAASMLVKIEKEGYSSILRQLDRGANCNDYSKCRFQFSLSKRLNGNDLHPDGCFIKGKPSSIRWEMRAVLEWDQNPRDLDIWARNWGCYADVERAYNCRGSNASSMYHPFTNRFGVCKRRNFKTHSVKTVEGKACAVKGCRRERNQVKFIDGKPSCRTLWPDQFPKWVTYASRYVDSMDRRVVGHDPDRAKKGQVQQLSEAANWTPDHYMVLDVDKMSGYGPETVTFKNVPPGVYQIVVNQYGGYDKSTLAQGNPRVTLYIGSNNVAFECKISPQCKQDAFVWNVVNINVTAGDADLNGEIEYSIRLIDDEPDMQILRRLDLPTRTVPDFANWGWSRDDLAWLASNRFYSDDELKNVCYGKCHIVDTSLEHSYGACLASRKGSA